MSKIVELNGDKVLLPDDFEVTDDGMFDCLIYKNQIFVKSECGNFVDGFYTGPFYNEDGIEYLTIDDIIKEI